MKINDQEISGEKGVKKHVGPVRWGRQRWVVEEEEKNEMMLQGDGVMISKGGEP